MKLTEQEQKICDKYRTYGKTGHTRCDKCPLMLSCYDIICYANIDGRIKEAKELPRL